jgi:UDP-N-acetylglucosamine:LPS N-acetylglucosamine transferase
MPWEVMNRTLQTQPVEHYRIRLAGNAHDWMNAAVRRNSVTRHSSHHRILAIASGGGHWVQLLRLIPAFQGHEVNFATVSEAYRSDVPDGRFFVVRDATVWNKVKLVQLAIQVMGLVCWLRPHTIISTGAAPGYFAIRFGKLIGAKTIWIDSMANVEQLSVAGRQAGKYADLWLTQWPHLASESGPKYIGSVL